MRIRLAARTLILFAATTLARVTATLPTEKLDGVVLWQSIR
jgi:hypothetical protein